MKSHGGKYNNFSGFYKPGFQKFLWHWVIFENKKQNFFWCSVMRHLLFLELKVQSNLVIWNFLIRNKLVLGNHFLWPIVNLLHKDKELWALRNNFRVTKKFLIIKFVCTSKKHENMTATKNKKFGILKNKQCLLFWMLCQRMISLLHFLPPLAAWFLRQWYNISLISILD